MNVSSNPGWRVAALHVFLLAPALGFLLAPAASRGGPCELPDLPSCTCFDSVAAWPLAGTPGDLVDVGHRMVGTHPSCINHGGQPYWQIQLQLSHPLLAEFIAAVNPDYQVEHAPEAWCTESVAYWGYMAQVPYERGFANPAHHPSSYVRGSNEMRRWFAAEEELGGRGRWIDGQELDYDNFMPGVNAPCPGAYQQIYWWDPTDSDGDGNLWDGLIGHSQVVDSMVVYRLGGQEGTVQKIDLHYVEGNAGSPPRVQADRWYRGIRDFTLLGPDSVRLDASGRKIRGWGIILDQYGSPVADWSRLKTVYTPVFRAPHVPLGPDDSDSLAIARLIAYAQAGQGALQVITNSKLVAAPDWPSPPEPWIIPPGQHPVDPVTIRCDLGAEYPVKMRGLVLHWLQAAPPRLHLQWEDGRGHVWSRLVTLGQQPNLPQGTVVPLRVTFQDGTPYPVRYIQLGIPLSDLTRTFVVQGLDFEIFDGEYEDANQSSPGGDAGVVGVPATREPDGLQLRAGAPNPTRGAARLAFHLPEEGRASITVHDVRGRRVCTLIDEVLPAGDHLATWEGRTDTGRPVAGGVYFVRLAWRNTSRTVRLIRLP